MKEKQTELLQQAISLDTAGHAAKKEDYQKIGNLTEFGKMLNPFGFLKGRQKVYARIISEDHPEIRENIQNEERREGFVVHISLLTEEMLQADYEYFNYEEFANRTDRFLTEEARKNYKPYYYEFTGFVRKSQEREYGMFSERVMDRWFTAWLNSDAVSEEGSYYIEGIVEFSASPFKEHGGSLEWDENSKTVTKEKQEKIDAWKLPDKDDQRLLKKVFLQVFDNARNKFRVKVYNVGQANCIYIRNRKHRIFFDVGIPKDSQNKSMDRKRPEVQRSMSDIQKSRPTMVILSHWDMDHIKGAFLLKDEAFQKYWITPQISSSSKPKKSADMKFAGSAERLAKYLSYNSRLLRVPNDKNGTEICRGRKGILWKGDGVGRKITKNNNYGLLLELDDTGSGKRALFSGDCEYESWPVGLLNKKIEKLIVPHHGSEMKTDKLKNIAPGYGEAIISVGEDGKGYKHPNGDHIQELKNVNYTVKQTLYDKVKNFSI